MTNNLDVKNVFTILVTLLFLVAPFNPLPNVAGQGFNLSYNISIWFIVTLIIGTGLYLISKRRCFEYPASYSYLIIFLFLIVLASFLAGSNQPIVRLFRLAYIVGGVAFLFSLFQFRVNTKQINKVLYLLVIVAFIDSIITIIQNIPRAGGIFRQVNVEASFLATGLLIAIYLISRPPFRKVGLLTKVIFLTTIASATYVITLSGSRIGLLSMLLGGCILLVCRRKQFARQKYILVMMLMIISISLFLGSSGLERVIVKTSQETESGGGSQLEYKSVRLTMYAISLNLVKQEPVFGHGIGSFLRVWASETEKFHKENPNSVLDDTSTTHPHNELLFWFIEGGVISIIAIIIGIGGVVVGLFNCGVERGGAYVAMLLPISLHTQVELPFYNSSLHWFVWLFLVFVVLRHNSRAKALEVSQSALVTIRMTAIILCVFISYFLFQITLAQRDIYKFLYDDNNKPPYLKTALQNPYFRPLAEKLAMKSLLYNAIENRNNKNVLIYIAWAELEMETMPEKMLFTDLIKAYGYLNMESKLCSVTRKALNIYSDIKLTKIESDLCALQIKGVRLD
tara:strand:- start:1334 stop:3037 length:1704 start_codon:yes stop_codon:yes gene_type:complete